MYVIGKNEQGDPEEFKRWVERTEKYTEWSKSARLGVVKVGDIIDACDTEYIWCKATVEMVVKTENRVDLLYIHYENWNRKYDEFMYQDSHRLAPNGLYTGRQDIPIYRMMGNRGQDGQMSMMYAVVLANAQEEARLAEMERRLSNHNPIDEDDDDDDEDLPDDPDQAD